MSRFKQLLTSFFPTPPSALNNIFISRSCLLHNLAYLEQQHPGQAIFPVLKSNAYGHGLKEVSTILRQSDVPYICVDSFPEYQIVKDFAQKKSLILGETRPENYRLYDPEMATPVIYTIEALKALIATKRKQRIHLFLNTGMNREGIQAQALPTFLDLLRQSSHIVLEGVMSHFANADEIENGYDSKQIQQFEEMYTTICQYIHPSTIIYRHINNSAGIAKHQYNLFNAHRAGIAFYGYNPLQVHDTQFHFYEHLQPALRVTSTIVAIQELSAGSLVSYGGKRHSETETMTATIPFGYYEGLNRSLTNNRSVQWKDAMLPLVGTICMNLSCLHNGSYPIQKGDQVELISNRADAPHSIMQFAQKTGTICYEVLVKLNEKIRRTITT